MAILSDEAKQFIQAVHPGMVATASKDGMPNVSPKGSFHVVDDEHVAFANIHSPRSMANIAENPQVSAIVFDPSTRHGCRIWGTAEVLSSGELLDRINANLAARKMQASDVVVISVDEFVTF
jgi:predicted pyridoxine 5'-phosphate oxidase superfamily flavin-nucleotide-binding protein